MAQLMLLQPQSEVTLSLPAIVLNPERAVIIGRGAEGGGRLPQDWLQVSSKHCAIRFDAEKVCVLDYRKPVRVPLSSPPGLLSSVLQTPGAPHAVRQVEEPPVIILDNWRCPACQPVCCLGHVNCSGHSVPVTLTTP